MRRVAIVNLSESTEAVAVDGLSEGIEEGERSLSVSIDVIVGKCEWREQPAPHGSLVVGGVAFARPAGILACVTRFAGGEAPQAERCE
jgi:hypothetical protein